jgi:alpha-D-ribose 1-methylphosphonate 5-triphosphate synthase subunit PhnL
MAWIDWDAVIAALDCGRLPESGGEKRIVRIAASLTADHPVSLGDAIPGLDHRSRQLVTITAIRHAAGRRQ